ncbi:MAG: class II fructose-bisphosphate aldolase [Nocardioidaceae bacterium]
MPLVPTAEIVVPASRERRGVGAFNVVQIELAEALVTGAESAEAPVILQISENAVRYHGALEPIALATLSIARSASIPVAVHLDHATDTALVTRAIELGFGSVMYDGSASDYDENVATTALVARQCADAGVFLEAELGEIGGKDGVHALHVRTDPKEARAFVSETGVNALAVAVGTSHAMQRRDVRLDLDLIGRLNAALPVPLVLHGSSGVPDGDLTRAVAAGITKVNIATQLNRVFTGTLRRYLAEHADVVDTRRYLAPARDAVGAEVARLLDVLRAI